MYRLLRRNVERIAESEREARALMDEGFVMISGAEEVKQTDDTRKLEELSVKELREIAEKRGIAAKTLKRKELLEVLK